MSKKYSNNKFYRKTILHKTSINQVHNARTGGQIALSGFSYQMLYSCYLILNCIDSQTQIYLEGIEDIDKISFENEIQNTMHIQLKILYHE